MASRAQVIQRYAAAGSVLPNTVEVQFRHQGRAGQIQSADRGRRVGDFGWLSLVYGLLGMAAPQPSDAVEVAEALFNLRFRPNELLYVGRPGSSIPRDTRFGIYLGHMIADLPALDAAAAAAAAHPFGQGLEVHVRLKPTGAYILTPRGEGEDRLFEPFSPESEVITYRNRSGLERGCIIRLPLLIAAAELLSDTVANQPTPIPNLAPGSAGEGNATPETTKASGTGIHEGLLSDVPATRAYPALAPTVALQAQSATKEGGKQSLSRPMGRESRVRQHRTTRSAHHGSHWTDTASP